MTIKEFMESNKALDNQFTNPDGEKYSETMAECTRVWSNAAAKGYVIRAAQHLKMNREQIKTLLIRMEWAFNDLTIEEAEKVYNDF